MGALEMGLTEEELPALVSSWREANPNIVKLWWDVDRAAMTAVKNKTTTETHGLRFCYESGFLFITLPSGRRLAYVKPRIGENQFGSPAIAIRRGLEADGIRNGAGNLRWHESNIKQILTNEKYIGDALLQKTYTVNTLEKKRAVNNGRLPKYYVEGSQEPIIDRMVFLKVQADMAERANLNSGGKKRVYSGKYALSSIVFCGHCGDIYRRIKWNNRGCKSTVWRCVSRIEKGGSACPARTINEEDLQAAVIYAVNKLFSCKNRVIPTLMENVDSVIDGGMDEKIAEIDRLIREKQTELLANEKDMVKAEEIGNRIIELREEKQQLLTEGALEQDKIERLEDMKNFLDGQNDFLTEYSDALTRRLVEKVTVYDEKIMVLFRSGLEIELMA